MLGDSKPWGGEEGTRRRGSLESEMTMSLPQNLGSCQAASPPGVTQSLGHSLQNKSSYLGFLLADPSYNLELPWQHLARGSQPSNFLVGGLCPFGLWGSSFAFSSSWKIEGTSQTPKPGDASV